MSTSAPKPRPVLRRMSGAVLTCTVLLALAACGDDGSSTADSTAPAPTGASSGAAPTTKSTGASTTSTAGATTTVTVTPGGSDGGGSGSGGTGGSGGSGGDGSGGGTGGGGSEPTVGRCHTSELAVSLTGGDAGAGSVYYTVDFRNTSGHDCTVSGYPGVSLVGNGDGTQIGAPAERDSATPVTTVTLSPGSSATAQRRASNPENYGDRCEVSAADGLRIYPPDELDSTYIAAPTLRGCVNDDVATMDIGPLTGA